MYQDNRVHGANALHLDATTGVGDVSKGTRRFAEQFKSSVLREDYSNNSLTTNEHSVRCNLCILSRSLISLVGVNCIVQHTMGSQLTMLLSQKLP
eukprot:scaffold258382_cov30-Prasinocladus_malaysianus.AAC.2